VGEARKVMDQVTQAFLSGDFSKAAALYAPDAVIVTPDQGELQGGDQFAEYMKQFFAAFPDAKYEPLFSYEDGNTAIDEGYFVGTNTGEIQLPTGDSLPATGKFLRTRSCDIATVENGRVTSHRLYFDQVEFLTQLGLMTDTPA
jgi:predicted ester cyclase